MSTSTGLTPAACTRSSTVSGPTGGSGRSSRRVRTSGPPYPSKATALIDTPALPPSLHVPPEGLLDLPARVPLGQVLPLVVGLLALGEGEGRLDLAVLEVQVERHQGQAALLGLADQLVDLGAVHEHLALAARGVRSEEHTSELQ